MTTIGTFIGGQVAAGPGSDDKPLSLLTALQGPSQGSVGLFDAALDRASTALPVNKATKVAAADGAAPATQPVGAAPGGLVAAERERARRALELEAPATPPTATPAGGDAIIEGLQKLRGVFDERTTRLNAIMSSKSVDVGTLMAMQMELVRFSLLVEVTSKLTGKSTQAFDTLMKGQ